MSRNKCVESSKSFLISNHSNQVPFAEEDRVCFNSIDTLMVVLTLTMTVVGDNAFGPCTAHYWSRWPATKTCALSNFKDAP